MPRSLLLSALLFATVPLLSAQTVPVTTSSDDARAHFEEARDRMHHVDGDGIREHLRAALAADPSFALANLYLALWSPPSERETLYANAQAGPASSAERQMIEAAILFDTDADAALDLLGQVAEAHPDDPWPSHHVGTTHYFARRYDEAVDAFHASISADPDFAGAHNMLGYAEMGRGDAEAAERSFRNYLRIAPDEANAHDSIGEFYMRQGRLDEATEHFEHALARDPDLAATRRNLVHIAIMQRTEQAEDAVRRQDAGALAAMYTNGARLSPPNQARINGRDDIRDFYAAVFEDGLDGLDVETTEVFPAENTVTELGTMTVRRGGQVVDEAKYTNVWVKNGETWMVHRSTWNSDRPVPTVARSN